MFSAGVTKVSKNRHVRRATRRKVLRSSGDDSSSSSSLGERLIQNATAGAANHAAANGAGNWPDAVGAIGRNGHCRYSGGHAGRHEPVVSNHAGCVIGLCLRRGCPLQQIFAAYGKSVKCAPNGIGHETSLMAEKNKVRAGQDKCVGKVLQ